MKIILSKEELISLIKSYYKSKSDKFGLGMVKEDLKRAINVSMNIKYEEAKVENHDISSEVALNERVRKDDTYNGYLTIPYSLKIELPETYFGQNQEHHQ